MNQNIYGCFQKQWYPRNHPMFNRVWNHYFPPSILGYHQGCWMENRLWKTNCRTEKTGSCHPFLAESERPGMLMFYLHVLLNRCFFLKNQQQILQFPGINRPKLDSQTRMIACFKKTSNKTNSICFNFSLPKKKLTQLSWVVYLSHQKKTEKKSTVHCTGCLI